MTSDPKFAQACSLHKVGDLSGAILLYQQLWHSSSHVQAAINVAAIYRQQSNHTQAIYYLTEVLKTEPLNGAAWGNLANNYMDNGLSTSAIPCYIKAISLGIVNDDIIQSLINAFRNEKLYIFAFHLSIATLKAGFIESGFQILEILALIKDTNGAPDSHLSSLVAQLISELQPAIGDNGFRSIQRSLYMASSLLSLNYKEDAKLYTQRAEQIPVEPHYLSKKAEYVNNIRWNLANKLLQSANFDSGWSFYDAGLKVKAEGKQRYQRSLFKPFSSKQISLWRGEDLSNKRILVLGEQGIGDTMMFTILLTTLLRKWQVQITFVPGDRLVPIYNRSFGSKLRIFKCSEILREDPSLFDYMTPIGSIMQYIWDQETMPYLKTPLLLADLGMTNKLRNRYKLNSARPTIGISWRGGGGKQKRVSAKSIELTELLRPLLQTEANFISLQYGNSIDYVRAAEQQLNTSIIYDTTVDPLKDMDLWLSQVSLCDIVVSVANTTVHGSGGLGIPTLCLVGHNYDWRWVDPELHHPNSYWYSSIEAIFKSDSNTWRHELAYISKRVHDMLDLPPSH